MQVECAEIDLRAYADNVRAIVADTTTHRVWAVVKADAYGHGAVECARVALDAGAQGLCVALVDEGVALRRAGIAAPILVMSEQPPSEHRAIVANGLIATVYNESTIESLAQTAAELEISCSVHLKVDTGMHRVGVAPIDAVARARRVRAEPWLSLDGVYSHLATADDPTRNDVTEHQARMFAGVLNDLKDAGIDVSDRHLENSAGALRHVAEILRLDSRVGIATYGIAGDPASNSFGGNVSVHLAPVMSLKARVSHVQVLDAGEAVSYGLRRPLTQRSTIATLPLGYADGVRRGLWHEGEVLIGGKRRRFAGVITMDQVMVDCGNDTVCVGDEAVLIGTQGTETIGANDWARLLGTIGYEVTCGISARIPRIYLR
ncbi:MAG: alanine racemase [Actinomycetota bacterium]